MMLRIDQMPVGAIFQFAGDWWYRTETGVVLCAQSFYDPAAKTESGL